MSPLLPGRKEWDDWSGWLGFFADLVGLSWDKVLAAARSAFSPELDLILALYETVGTLAEKGFDGLLEWLNKMWEMVKEKIDFDAIREKVIEGVLGALTRIAIEQAVEWAASLIPWVGAVKAIKAIWHVLVWIYDNESRLLDLFSSIVEGFKALLGGAGQEAVAQLVEGGLSQVFVVALDLIAKEFGLDVIPKTIRKVVGEITDWVPNQVRNLLLKVKQWLKDHAKSLLKWLFGKKTWEVRGHKHELWVDREKGEVVTSGSPAVGIENEFNRLDKWAKKNKNSEVQKLVSKGRAELPNTKKLMKQAQAEEQAQAKVVGTKQGKQGTKGAKSQAVPKKSSGTDQKLDKSTNKLADILKEAQQLEVGGSCPVKGGANTGQCFRWGMGNAHEGAAPPEQPDGVERREVMQRVLTVESGGGGPEPAGAEEIYGPKTHVLMVLRLNHGDGTHVDIRLARSRAEAEAAGAMLGGAVRLNMPEMGAVGQAWVLWLGPCPVPEPGRGRLVTGTFHHSAGVVCELQIEGEPRAIGVTPGHPFWSVDRQAWIAAGELWIGERLAALDGSTPWVLSRVACMEAEPVYNIEVEGDHCYRVGQQGLLVHNASGPSQDIQDAIEKEFASHANCNVCGKTTINLAQNWRSEPLLVNPIPNAGYVYTVRSQAGVLLKIGETSSPLSRFTDYVTAMYLCQQTYGNILVDLWVYDQKGMCNILPSKIESDARKTICPTGQPTICPWDNSGRFPGPVPGTFVGRLGRQGPGTPGKREDAVGAWISCTVFQVSATAPPPQKVGRKPRPTPTLQEWQNAITQVGCTYEKLAEFFQTSNNTIAKWKRELGGC